MGGFSRFWRKWAVRAALGSLALISSPGRVEAAQATANPSADAMLYSDEPQSNYGGAGQLSVADPGQDQGEYQTLMRFDLGPAKAAFDAAHGAGRWRLESATLRLSTSNPNNPIFNPNEAGTFAVGWMANDSWVEGTGGPTTPTNDGVAFANLGSLVGPSDEGLGTFSFPGGTSGTNTYSLGVGQGFSDDVEAGSAATLRLFAPAGASVSYNFSSRSFQQAANRPVLTLTAAEVPEPSGVLVVGGLVAVWGRRRRQSLPVLRS